MTDDFSQGIVLGASPNAKVVDNTVTGNGAGFGIGVGEETTGARLTGNVATGNSIDLGDSNPGSPPDCANTWRDNTFATTDQRGAGAACIQ